MNNVANQFAYSLSRLLSDHEARAPVSSGTALAWSEDLWNEVDALGLGLLGVDEAHGGAGGDADALFDVLATLGRHAAPLPGTETVVAAWLLSEHGISAPPGVIAVATDADDVSLDDDNRLNGELRHVPWGRAAGHVVFLLPATGELVLAPAPSGAAGENLASEPSDTLRFDSTEPLTRVAAQLNAIELLRFCALARCAQMCGAMHATLELTMQYVSDREQFGRPLRKFQAIQHHLAVMYSDVVAASTATRGALSLDEPHRAAFESAAAIVRTREAATRLAATAHQAHGAIGFTADYALGRLTKRLWAWRDEYGDEKWWRESLGELVLADGEKSLWELLTDGSG